MSTTSYQLFHDNIANENYLQNSIAVTLKDIYNIMKECYGPYGSHILIQTKMRPESTKDGKMILSRVHMNGSISSSVQSAILSVAEKQVEEVGDGSTTTILLVCKLYEAFRKIITTLNLSPSTFQSMLQETIDIIIKEIDKYSTQLVLTDTNTGDVVIDFDLLYNVIYTSVDGDEGLANKILEMFKELNCVEPLIMYDTSKDIYHHYETVKGVEVPGNIINNNAFFSGFSRCNYDNPDIIVINGRMEVAPDIYDQFHNAMLQQDRTVIFITCGVSEGLLGVIESLGNNQPGAYNHCPIFQIGKTSSDPEFLDMCAMLGAKPVDQDTVKSQWKSVPAMLSSVKVNQGRCEKALLTEFTARFNAPVSDDNALKARIEEVDEAIEKLKADPTSMNATLSEMEARRTYLSKKYAKFYVGGQSPQRKYINRELADDAIRQAISSMKHGIIPGCNVIIPSIIQDKIVEYDNAHNDSTHNQIIVLIMAAIQEAYSDLFYQLVANAYGDEKGREIFDNHIKQHGYIPLNLREGDTVNICNSADTDRAILQFATDMSSLLATAKGFLSLTNEFDIINKGFDSEVGE